MISANYLRHKLKPGTPLVLCGPQGCGKTTLARAIAKLHCGFIECDVIDFTRAAGWKAACATLVDTIIVNGMPRFAALPEELKSLLAGGSIAIRQPYSRHSARSKPKKFIFCCHEDDLSPEVDRRFYTVNMPAREA